MAEALLALGMEASAISFSRASRSRDLVAEMDDVRRARDALLTKGIECVALVGRSFGGRVCTRVAALERPAALVVLGHPISPPNRPRPDDEAALAAVSCPTLIVQGDHDRLGPLRVLERIAANNSRIELYVLTGVGHHFGARQRDGVQYAATWLRETLSR